MAKIETKIKIGDKFWVIYHGKVEIFTLDIIEAKETDRYCRITYYSEVPFYTGIHAGNNNTDNHLSFDEDSCFATKEELLDSL